MKKLSLTLTFAVILIFVGCTVVQADAEIPICTAPNRQQSAAISGDRIVWADNRSGGYDIYMYDLATGEETQITTDPAGQDLPAISGNRIVWRDVRNGIYNSDIYMYNLTNMTEIPICTHPSSQSCPAISGEHIVWMDYRNGRCDIYMYDLATGEETRITNDAARPLTRPAISGTRIVWQDERYEQEDIGDGEIFMYDLATGEETRITSELHHQRYPAIWGQRIVYDDNRNGHWDIYMYDLATGEETRITTDPTNQELPAIFDNRIVWQEYNYENDTYWDIYMYDLSTGTKTSICTAPDNQENPVIWDGRIVWRDMRAGFYQDDIYMYEFSVARRDIDIKPGSCPNPVNVKSSGVLPVAILGTIDYNITTIDPTSIRLAGVEPLRSGYEDVATPVSDSNDCNCTTDGPDGFLDLTLKFKTQRIVEAVGDVNDGDVLTIELTGVLYDETPIEGTDCILIRGRHKSINPADINKDGVVNTADFAIFAQNWLQSSIVDE